MNRGNFRITLFLFLVIAVGCSRGERNDDRPTDRPEGVTGDSDQLPGGDTAEIYKELVSENEQPNRIIWQKPDLVLSKLGPLENKVVADIGAGTGYFSFRLARKGARVIAIDIDPNAIEWMRLQKNRFTPEVRGNLDIRLADRDDPNLGPGEADLVLMVNTYIYLNDRVQYLENLKNGIKPGARLVIIDFKKKSTMVGPLVDERISLLEVEKDLKSAGYSILNSDDRSLDYQYIITAVFRN